MKIDSIINGIVIDHIQAGKSMELYQFLKLDELDCAVAIIQNAPSHKSGKKDIIKIDCDLKIDLNVLGYMDPGVTINVISDGKRVKKFHPELPELVENIIRCKNPRCITTTEQELPSVFRLTDRAARVYRCVYCEAKQSR